MQFLVEIGRCYQAVELASGYMCCTDISVSFKTEFQQLAEQELPGGHLYGFPLVIGVCHTEASLNLYGLSNRLFQVFLKLSKCTHRFRKGFTEGDEQFKNRINLELDYIVTNSKVSYRKVVSAVVCHLEYLQHSFAVVYFDFYNFQSLAQSGILGKRE